MSTPLRIAVVNNYPGQAMGGGEVQLLALVRGLAARNVSVAVACVAGSEFERQLKGVSGVDVVPCSFSKWSLIRLPAVLSRRFGSADIVQGSGFLTNLIARRVGAIMHSQVVNVVQVVPGAARFEGEGAPAAAFRRLVQKYRHGLVRLFIVPSRAVRDALISGGVAPALVEVVPNGVDVDALISAASKPIPAALPSLGSPRIGYAGRLTKVKGCDVFLRAAVLLAPSFPDAVFPIAGAGPEEGDLRALAHDAGIQDRVVFLGYMDEVAPFLEWLDVVVVPSRSEAFGLTALEAQALGRPVVASAVDGLPDVVVHGRTGLLVAAEDPGAIAAAATSLVDDPEYGRQLGEAGRRRVREQFALEPMVEAYLEAYKRVLGA